MSWKVIVCFTLAASVVCVQAAGACPNAVDYLDPTYAGKVRQLQQPSGHEHNLYYHRNPWNSDGTYMVGVHSDLQQQNWRVVLYSGDGCYIKELFPIELYDWRLVWDRSDPEVLYTFKGPNLYRYNVVTGALQLLKSFAPLNIGVSGPSLNQNGDRILVITSDGAYRSYRLPDMNDERMFRVTLPPGCNTDFEDERYIGYRSYIAATCVSPNLLEQHMYVYDDTGELFHKFDGVSLGHTDFSPDGQWAYGRMWGAGKPLQVRLVNLDGSNDRVVYEVPQAQAAYVQNFHISWPDRVTDWFVVSFFPSAANLPPSYSPPLDEILRIDVGGASRFLARSGTTVISRGETFWAETLASPSGDGRRISFNSNRSGTIDQFILTLNAATRRRSVRR